MEHQRKSDEGVGRLGSPGFQAALPFIKDRLIPAYAGLGQLSFAYCQGSMVENLASHSDIDTVFVWKDSIPAKEQRPPRGMADAETQAVTWEQQEKLWCQGQEYGIAHVTLRIWQSWIEQLQAGDGCSGYPTPVIAAHGFVSGVILYDSEGEGLTLQRQLGGFPEALRVQPVRRAKSALPSYLESLQGCAENDDALLFHGELVAVARLVWIGWFSAQQRYWPLEKRLGTRLRLLGRDDLADAEESVWLSGPGLRDRLHAFRQLADKLLSEMPA